MSNRLLRLALWGDLVLSWIERLGGYKVLGVAAGGALGVPLLFFVNVLLGIVVGLVVGIALWLLLTAGGRPLRMYVKEERSRKQHRALEKSLELLRDTCDFEAFGEEPTLRLGWQTQADNLLRRATPQKLDEFDDCETLGDRYGFISTLLDQVNALEIRPDWKP